MTYVARSIAIPGWGQMAKGERGKGWTVLAATAFGAGAALAGDLLRHRMLDSASGAQSQAERDRQLQKADQFRAYAIGAATIGGTFYGYGVLDAMIGPVHVYPMIAGRGFGLGGAVALPRF